MSTDENLRSKTCIPCQGGVPPLDLQEIDRFAREISSEWKVTHESTRIFRSVKTKNFEDSMKLAIKIGLLADEQWHHPELVVGFGHLDVEVWTHKINGLVESDFVFASKVDQIFEEDSSLIIS